MSRYLINEPPLLFSPSLANLIGLNEAIVLQQLNYWLQQSAHDYDGYKWVYNTYEAWEKQFPFWSNRTLRRIFEKLEKDEIVISGNYNKLKLDRTKWYRINYAKLNLIENGKVDQLDSDKVDNSCGQNDLNTSGQNDQITLGQNDQTNNQRLPETNTETTNHIVEIVTYLNALCGTKFSPETKETKKLINGLYKKGKGYTVEDFKTVIDRKYKEWKGTRFEEYLRPKTLFAASNFESYINHKGKKSLFDQGEASKKRQQSGFRLGYEGPITDEDLPF